MARPLRGLLADQIPRLRRYARALTADPDRADDLVQDCLERALSRSHQWRAGSDLRAWLFTILHNLHINALRRDLRRAETPLDSTTAAEQQTRCAGDGELHLQELERVLAQLPDDQREVLLLVCLEEMSYAQVAQVLGLPIGTVMSRLHRARARVRAWRRDGERPTLRSVK
jgi:RNA polymerase sigma-70 factor (ECF subfamily)